MEINLYLLLSLLIALLVISYLLGKLHRVRGQLFLIRDALNDIKAGNLNRRVLARESDLTKQICYDINEIAMSSQSRLIQQKQSEQAYKRLMTSLSHDVKTPLASLVGYLEAVESKMVTGAEKEEYIRVAMEKAYHLKDFVTALFEWVKLDAGEQIFHFEVCDLNELSRDIMADWVPLLENHDLSYEIEIPETEYMTRVDSTAYTRICETLTYFIRSGRMPFSVSGHSCSFTYLSAIHFLPIRRTAQMDELNPTVREQEIYEEMELTPEMIKSIRTLCATCLRHFVEAKAFKIALVPSADRSMDTCTVCQTRRGHDYVVMHR